MADEESVSSTPATESAPPASAPESSPAPSPPASTEPPSTETGTSKESLLDAVLKVVPATTEADVLAPTDKAAAPEATEPDGDQAETDLETDDDDKLPQGVETLVRKKFNRLLKQRKQLQAELAGLRQPADIGSELETFAKSNDLSGDDVANGLHIMAMLRAGDYRSFYTAIAPYVRTAQEVLGVVLPKDLAEQVQQRQMTENVARDYARQRIEGQRAEYELQARTQALQRQQVQAVQGDVQRAVSSFELRLSASDPDYKAKAPVVRRVAQGMLLERGNQISSVQEALDISRAAYDEVNKQMRAFQPVPRATHPSPNGATQTSSARAAPKTLMEAAIQGLENARRGG